MLIVIFLQLWSLEMEDNKKIRIILMEKKCNICMIHIIETYRRYRISGVSKPTRHIIDIPNPPNYVSFSSLLQYRHTINLKQSLPATKGNEWNSTNNNKAYVLLYILSISFYFTFPLSFYRVQSFSSVFNFVFTSF